MPSWHCTVECLTEVSNCAIYILPFLLSKKYDDKLLWCRSATSFFYVLKFLLLKFVKVVKVFLLLKFFYALKFLFKHFYVLKFLLVAN